MSTPRDEDICWLYVAMNNAFCMGSIECISNFEGERENQVRLHRAIADSMFQRNYRPDIPWLYERLPVGVINLVDRADVGLVQRRCSLRFTVNAGERFWVVSYFIREEFEGYEAMQLHIFGLVNDTHPAAAELSQNAIVGDSLPDHWAEILGLEEGQVNEGVAVGCLVGQLL